MNRLYVAVNRRTLTSPCRLLSAIGLGTKPGAIGSLREHSTLTSPSSLWCLKNRLNCSLKRSSSTMAVEPQSSYLNGLDDVQLKLMEEECILVDNDDKPVGAASKKVCHLVENINKGMLHRAFSVFLFNSAGHLLLQQRSAAKITFPGHWTNTCCSHPLNFSAELDEHESLGVKRAAQRKLKHELGIEPEQIPLDAFRYLTRIHYRSDNVPRDGMWAEHEIDYILVIQRDVQLEPNTNEVASHRYVTRDHLRQFISSSDADGTLITPWFRLVVDNFLYKWWDGLDDLQRFEDHSTIHRMC